MPSLNHKHFQIVIGAILVTALFGFFDATYLTVEHYRAGDIPCTLTGGCQTVTTSEYATIGPIPIALLGAMFYLTVLVLAALTLSRGAHRFLQLLTGLTGLAFFISLYLVGLQAFVIRAYCFYCLLSAITSTLLFILVFISRRIMKQLTARQETSTPTV